MQHTFTLAAWNFRLARRSLLALWGFFAAQQAVVILWRAAPPALQRCDGVKPRRGSLKGE